MPLLWPPSSWVFAAVSTMQNARYAIKNGKYAFTNAVRFLEKWHCNKCEKGKSIGTYGQFTHCHHCRADTRTRDIIDRQHQACGKLYEEQQRGSRSSTGRRSSSSDRYHRTGRGARGRDRDRGRAERYRRGSRDERGDGYRQSARERSLERELAELKKQQQNSTPPTTSNTSNRPNPSARHPPAKSPPPSSAETYDIHDDEPEPPTEAECQAILEGLHLELKLVNDGLKSHPKAPNFLSSKSRLLKEIETAKANHRSSKAPEDQLAAKGRRLQNILAKQRQETGNGRYWVGKLKEAEQDRIKAEEELQKSFERHENCEQERAQLQKEIAILNKECYSPTAPLPPSGCYPHTGESQSNQINAGRMGARIYRR